MKLDDIYKYWLFFAAGGFFIIWGTLVTIRKVRGMLLPKPSVDEINSLFKEVEKIPLIGSFADRIDSTSSNLGIFEDHVKKYFGKISHLAKRYSLLFVGEDLHGGDEVNLIRGDVNELRVKKVYYDGRGRQGILVFRVQLKLILTKEAERAFFRSNYEPILALFEDSIYLESVRREILNSLEKAVHDRFDAPFQKLLDNN